MNKSLYITLLKLTSALILLISLITMSETCLEGARAGLMLWFNTLLPTLFPFFVVTRLIIELDICPHSLHAAYPLFAGLIAGYPTGALTCSEMNLKGYISTPSAQCLLAACNNASPAFLISYAACSCLGMHDNRYIIWASVILGSLTTSALCYIFVYHRKNPSCEAAESSTYNTCNTDVTGHTEYAGSTPVAPVRNLIQIIEDTIMRSFEVLVMIGGYVILFSIFAYLLMLLPIPESMTAILSGILEITTGCGRLASCNDIPLYIKSTATAVLSGFGGISAILQTNSAIKDSQLSITQYVIHKIICGIISGILCYIFISVLHM